MATVTWAKIANLKGVKGDKGDAGTFDNLTAEIVAPNQPLTWTISGDRGQFVHFKFPRGLDGVNAVENDTAVAGYIGADGTQVDGALRQRYATLGALSKGAAWGSSTVAGSGASSDSTNLVGRLSAFLGIAMYNGGQGGELITHHAARSGAVPALVTVPNGTIPASGTVNVTVENFSALRLDRVGSFTGTLFGVAGTLSYGTGGMRFTRTTSGSVVRVPDRVPFMPTGDQYRDRFTLINAGKNTLVEPPYDSAQVIEYTRRMAAHAPARTVVMGHWIDRDETDAGTIAAVQAVNAQYAIDYGERFIDVQRFLTSRFLWYVTGISPTNADLQAQMQGRKAPSISADTYHLNDAGYAAVAWLIATHLRSLGWFTPTLPPLPPEPVIPTIPAQVTNLRVARGDGQATATWDAVSGATSYQVERRTGTGTWLTSTTTGTSQVITGLTNGTAYQVRVAAINSDGTGLYSDVQTVTPAVPAYEVFTSSAFTTARSNLVGTYTDAALGGTAKLFESSLTDAGFAASGGALAFGATAVSQFLAIAMPNARQRIEVKVTGMPVSAIAYIVARRAALASANSYRIALDPAGTAKLQRTNGATPVDLAPSTTFAVGDVIGLDCDGSTITLRKNGVAVGSVTDTNVTGAGYAGIARSSNGTSLGLDDLVITALY